jgi:hypothetical protein
MKSTMEPMWMYPDVSPLLTHGTLRISCRSYRFVPNHFMPQGRLIPTGLLGFPSRKENQMQRRIGMLPFILAVVFACISATTVRADEVTDWNQILFQAFITDNTLQNTLTRNAAIVQASVFDAVNGIERRYTHIHVTPDAPHGASARAAAVQAAYASLLKLFPNQQSTFDAARDTSLAAILNKKGGGHEERRLQKAVDRGLAWGHSRLLMLSGLGEAPTVSTRRQLRSRGEPTSASGAPLHRHSSPVAVSSSAT